MNIVKIDSNLNDNIPNNFVDFISVYDSNKRVKTEVISTALRSVSFRSVLLRV
jgi:hypothetical protein